MALRAGRMSLEESRRCCASTKTGLAGYTYLEREVDAPAMAANGQLRLVEKAEPASTRTGT